MLKFRKTSYVVKLNVTMITKATMESLSRLSDEVSNFQSHEFSEQKCNIAYFKKKQKEVVIKSSSRK